MPDISAELRQRNRAAWGAGEWDAFSPIIAEVGPTLLDYVGMEPDMDVLDVGTGSGGTLAIPAALRGGRVVGSDLVPAHFEHARRRARESGVDVEWVEADAEALPFEDVSFDRVLSTFGHMFAPRHGRAAAELARVCRRGGIVGLATWRPIEFAGGLFETMGRHLPPPPDFAEPPALWGQENHVRELLEPHGIELEFHHETAVFVHEGDVDGFVTVYEEKFGPVVMAKAALGEAWRPLRDDLLSLFDEWNEGSDGQVRIRSEYLVSVGRKRG